jgi:hypothetical protein
MSELALPISDEVIEALADLVAERLQERPR